MKSLDFDDVCLVPRVISEIESRDEIKIQVNLGRTQLTCPIIASPMKDVCDGNVAKEMHRLGGLGIIHRFSSIEEQVEEFKKCPEAGCAIGVIDDYYERFTALFDQGCRTYIIDVANGASSRVRQTTEKLANYPIDLIAGNVASKECYEWLESLPNVISIRCSIATGKSCTTKNATGICRGVFSTIQECASVKKKTILIADGGISEPSDMCKAIAAGADCIMLGNLIANTKESPAKIEVRNDRTVKVYRGSASFHIQKDYKEVPKYIEGTTRYLEHSGQSIEQLLTRFNEGLRSSMSYFNARTLEEYRKNVTFEFRE